MTEKYVFKSENGDPISVELPFKIACNSNWERIRALTFWSKEPETLYWIGCFEDDSVFWDIGANIGVYSLFCAYCNWCSTVYAFEPQASNFLSLLSNIHNNNYGDYINPQFVAMSDESGSGRFYVKSAEIGSSGGQIEKGEDFECEYQIPIITGDEFAIDYGYPHYIKIDVDGNELPILRGMDAVLSHGNLKSLLVEANDPDVIGHLENYGFIPDFRFNCLRGAGWKRISNTNIIFRRN